MKRILFFVLLIFPRLCFSQESLVEEAFVSQMIFFNEHDVEGMTNGVSDDMVYYYVMADSLVEEIRGKDAFRKAMTEYFESTPNVQSKIISSFQSGEMISFEEEVSWGEEGNRKSARSLGVYQIKQGAIYRAWYFIPE